MDTNFMDDDATKNTATETKVTIGDREYTQDELNNLVSLGSKAQEIQKNHGDLDNLVSDWGRTKNDLGMTRKELEELKSREAQARAAAGTLSQEELIKKAKQEAAGIGLITDDNVDDFVTRKIEQYRLNDAVSAEVANLEKMGIVANADTIKRYMRSMEGDTVDLDDAIKDLYGPQVKMYQDSELAKSKGSSLYTEGGSNAGGFRVPDNVKITDDNVGALLAEALGGSQ